MEIQKKTLTLKAEDIVCWDVTMGSGKTPTAIIRSRTRCSGDTLQALIALWCNSKLGENQCYNEDE